MQRYHDCPQVLREFLIYHENIKGQSPLTISEYYLDLRMFLRFIKLMRNDMPMSTNLDLSGISTHRIFSTFFPIWPMTGQLTRIQLLRSTEFPLPQGPESFRPLSPSINI